MEKITFTTEQKRRFQKLFNIKYQMNDENGILFRSVLNLDPSVVDEEFHMTFKDFEQYLFVKNVNSFKLNSVRLRQELINGEKYHYIHAWGRNGKTTFIRKFINDNKSKFNFALVDFKDFQINRTEKRHSLTTKTIEFFLVLLSIFGEKLIETMLFALLHIESTQLAIKQSTFSNEQRKNYNFLFSSFRKELIGFVNQVNEEAKKTSGFYGDDNQKKVKLFNDKFESFIDSLYQQKELNPIELFNFLLLITIKLYGSNDKKTIVIFDNIDDILTHSSEYLTAQIFPQVYDFIKILNSYLNIQKEYVSDNILDEIYFVFSYRTANYISSIYHINHNPSSKDRRYELMNAPVYALSTVKITDKIIRNRINFYDQICNTFNIEKYAQSSVVEKILHSFYDEKEDYTYLLKLWNGNHHAFNKVLSSISLQEADISVLIDPNVSTNIKRGIFFYYVTKTYVKDSNHHVNIFSTLSSVLQYTFTSELCEDNVCRCNLLRMFLTYIINHNNQYLEPKEHSKKNIDIFNKGVSVREVLDKLTQFKSDGTLVYQKELFEELFNRLFHDDIDVFDYLIICYKNTDLENPSKRFGKKYNFIEDLKLYFDNIATKTNGVLNVLDSIKLYYNANSEYLLNPFKKHFEFISCSINNHNNPLPLKMKIFKSTKEKLFKNLDFEAEHSFNNVILLEDTFEKMEHSIRTITSFYKDSVFEHYPPVEYCERSLFALDKTFHFDAIISKHITYIEKVRQAIRDDNIKIECQLANSTDYEQLFFTKLNKKTKADFSARFIYWIEKYIKLFNETYYSIEAEAKIQGVNMDSHSQRTLSSFKKLQSKIDKIKKTAFNDFITNIETSD